MGCALRKRGGSRRDDALSGSVHGAAQRSLHQGSRPFVMSAAAVFGLKGRRRCEQSLTGRNLRGSANHLLTTACPRGEPSSNLRRSSRGDPRCPETGCDATHVRVRSSAAQPMGWAGTGVADASPRGDDRIASRVAAAAVPGCHRDEVKTTTRGLGGEQQLAATARHAPVPRSDLSSPRNMRKPVLPRVRLGALASRRHQLVRRTNSGAKLALRCTQPRQRLHC